MTIKRIDALSLAKTWAVFMAIIGFFAGVCYFLFGTTMDVLLQLSGLGIGLGVFAIVVFPIIYAIIGFISGGIFVFLYNLTAEITGGIKIEL